MNSLLGRLLGRTNLENALGGQECGTIPSEAGMESQGEEHALPSGSHFPLPFSSLQLGLDYYMGFYSTR